MKTSFGIGILVWLLLAAVSVAEEASPRFKVVKPEQFPDPALAKRLVIAARAEVKLYQPQSPGTHPEPSFAVYVPRSYSPRKPLPLVVSSHGGGGNGKNEIGAWPKFAEQYGFIVVCPSYGIAALPIIKAGMVVGPGAPQGQLTMLNPEVLVQEEQMLSGILDRVFRSLNIDQELVLHTGMSGGGHATLLLGMKHPEVFTALCYRSCNFAGPLVPMDVRSWVDRPIYVFWGERDTAHIIVKGARDVPEGPAMLAYYKQLGCTRLKHEIIPRGGHDSRPDLAAKWFAEEVVRPALEARQEKAKAR